MKRIISLIAVLACIMSAAVFANDNINEKSRAKDYITGDVNLDKVVDMNDAILLLQHSMFPDMFVLEYKGSVDFVKDGYIDMNDAILLLQHSMFPELFPLEDEGICTVTFYDLAWSEEPVSDPIKVPAGSKAVYPDDYELWFEFGYEKSGNTDYFDDYVEGESYFGYDYTHKLDYEWYCLDENGEYVRYDDNYVIQGDIDVYSKIKKIDVQIEVPKSIANVDEVLIFNIPYENNTRYLDMWRDALFFNRDQIITKIDETGIEEIINDKYAEIDADSFENGSIFNDDYEFNNTDVYLYLYDVLGGKEQYKAWLWEKAEEEVTDAFDSETANKYFALKDGRTREQALRAFFEENVYNLDFTRGDYADAKACYMDSKEFIVMSTEENVFYVTVYNDYIVKLIEKKLMDSSMAEVFYDMIPKALADRLPLKIVEDIFAPRVQRFVSQLYEARQAAKAGKAKEDYPVDSAVHFDINLITEFITPLLGHVRKVQADAIDRISSSNNATSRLVEKYHVDNPYATSYIDGYLFADFFVEDTDEDGFYSPKSMSDKYDNVMMPLEVQKADALLWFAKQVEFDEIEAVISKQENKQIGLHLTNRINALRAEYSQNGLPNSVADYYEALLEDQVIKDAVEKLDNNIPFDMMFFVETKLNYELCEMFYMKMLDNLGIPDNMILADEGDVQYTEQDYDNYVERLEKIWSDTYTVDDYFDEMLAKSGQDGEIVIKMNGMSATVKRFISNSMFD